MKWWSKWPVARLLAAVVVLAVTARLGVWQLDRAAQKLELQTQVEQQALKPALAALAPSDLEELVHRRAVLQGHWAVRHTVYLDNRQMNGRPGFFVLTPLVMADGRTIVVQRGWIPRHSQDRTALASVQTPDGLVEVSGRIAPPPSKLMELRQGSSGHIRQNLDLAELERESGLTLVPVTLVDTRPASEGLLRDWPVPTLGVAKHYGYAFQWFALSALVFLLYVWFEFVQPRRRRSASTAHSSG
jgi:surfeit locus 1 family protein